jgi:hypothetical protein
LDGTIYHWQARGSNAASTGSWTILGGNPDFGVDTSGPSNGSIIYTDGDYTTAVVALTVDDGTDLSSGVNTSSRIIKRKSATLSSGSCESYGSFDTIIPAGSYPSYLDSTVSSDNCYQYQYLVSDNVGNQSIYTSLNTAKVNTGSPTTPETTHVDFSHSKSSSDWYKNGTRIELSNDDGHTIEYQWVSGKDGQPKDGKWKDYKGSIKAKSGKNTLYWKVDGDTHHRYMKVKDKDYITSLKSSIEPNTKTVTLSWNIQSSDKASKVKIYRDKYSGDFALDNNHLIGINAIDDTTFIINNPNSWGNYYYKIVVYDKNGNEIQNSSIFVQVPK